MTNIIKEQCQMAMVMGDSARFAVTEKNGSCVDALELMS